MKWRVHDPSNVPDEFVEAIGTSRRIGEILYRRGIRNADQAKGFLNPKYYSPAPASDLPGLVTASDIIEFALKRRIKIGIWGDFDVDGQTATTLLVDSLEKLGANVVYHIPLRESESHGINIPNLKNLIDEGIGLLVTCDTGISAHVPIAYAKEQGLQIIITDHHDIPPEVPDADAIVNSKLLDKTHVLGMLPGVGVAFKLIEHLFERNGLEELTERYLDLAALGIVADVAQLTGDNRYLLQLGLSALNKTKRLGLQVLFENADLNPKQISEDDIGFSIAPRLNSLGRLGDANLAVEFLTTDDPGRAAVIATQLEGLNSERRLLTSQVFEAIITKIDRSPDLISEPVIIVSGEKWPGGVLGIVANRLVERYRKPAVVLSSSDGEIYSGSARSTDGVDISEAVSRCSNLLLNFGGHPMAAGMALEIVNLKSFKSQLSEAVSEQIPDDPSQIELEYDFNVSLDAINLSLAEEINLLSPFGPGNPPIILALENIRIVSCSIIGRNEEHLRLIVEDDNDNRETVFWWGGAGNSLPQEKCNLALILKINHFQGSKQPQLEMIDYWFDEAQQLDLNLPKLEVIDLRTRYDIFDFKIKLEEPEAFFWSEILDIQGVETKPRSEAEPSDLLYVVSLPPSPDIFKEVLKIVQPQKVFFLGKDPKIDNIEKFLRRLGGLCKYALTMNKGGIPLIKLGEAMAHTISAVHNGLQWLNARGEFLIQEASNGEVIIGAGKAEKINYELLGHVEKELRQQIRESRAYRKFLVSLSTPDLKSYISDLLDLT